MGKPRRMTAVDWDICSYPGSMLPHLRTGSARKLRLFVCACLRHTWPLLTDARSRQAVEGAELWADGLLGVEDLSRVRKAAEVAKRTVGVDRAHGERKYFAARAAEQAAIPRKDWVVNTAWCSKMAAATHEREEHHQCHLLRDIFPNPFRPMPAIDPAWLSWNDRLVRKMAQAIYDERILPEGLLDQSRLAILADALEEPGCDNEEILSHLRQQGAVHVRGCWAIDLLLGKE